MGRLRNKKTGEIVTIGQELGDDFDGVGLMLWVDHVEGSELDDYKIYGSIDELNEEWEDYKPPEPIIKDEKVRKFVRDWATFNKIVKACIQRLADNDNSYKILGNDKEARCAWAIYIHASYSETISDGYNCNGPMVPIAELCGEEE